MAKYKPDFIITVLSESLQQYNSPTQAPASLGPFGAINLRRKCVPYIAGSLTALDRNIRAECGIPPIPSFDIATSLLVAGGQLYSPLLTYEQTIYGSLIAPGAQLYDPTFALGVPLALQTPGSHLYNPTIFFDYLINTPLLSPGSQLYDPSISVSITMPLQGSGGQVYSPEIAKDSDMPLITIGSQLYSPGILYAQNLTISLLSPGSYLYNPSIVFNVRIPLQTPGSQLYDPTFGLGVPMMLQTPGSQLYVPIFNLSTPMLLQSPGGQLYIPTVTQASVVTSNFYTQIISASNPNNSSSMQVGSIYLDARTYTTIGAMITDIKGGEDGSNAHIELRRFTNGTTLMTATNTSTAGPAWRYVTASSVVVSTADWYDIYISASGNPATSSIRGIYYEY